MELNSRIRIFTLLNRELQEYRTSLILTPLVIGGALVALMLVSVIFANRIALLGDGLMGVLSGEDASGVNLQIQIDNEGDAHIIDEKRSGKLRLGADSDQPAQQLIVKPVPEPLAEEAWNFSKEWTFSPPHRERQREPGIHDHEIDSLNPVLMGLNNLFMFIMFLVLVNYLLGCLYSDRKDRSILFFKSMPVSEWHEVLCKLGVALLIVPVVFLAASIITQMLSTALAMLLVWRMGGAPVEVVLSNVQFGSLLMNQLAGSVVLALWVVPTYAWLMLASAAARRSPFLLAIAIPIALVFAEEILIGTHYVLSAIGNHVPRLIDGDDSMSLGIYVHGPVWSQLDYLGMLMGFGFAALALSGAVWLRRYRFET
jgi:hypothetical protein